MFEAGSAKIDITAFQQGVGMMGYGMFWNTVEKIETPLFVRTYVFKDVESGKKIAFVNAEIAMITIAIRAEVIRRMEKQHRKLGFTSENIVLTAQHTHSGPGGYSHHAFYNLSIIGYQPQIFETIVSGIVDSIVNADAKLEPVKLTLQRGSFSEDKEVAFNRSYKAYNANPEVTNEVYKDETHHAVDREMAVLKLSANDKSLRGMISWFGVHATSISNDNHGICADNKGYASSFTEARLKSDSKVDIDAIFAQAPTGDVSPNWIWDKKKNWTRGKFEDDFESAQYNGQLQSDLAIKLLNERDEIGNRITGKIDHVVMHVDFSDVEADPEFTDGEKNCRTYSAAFGVSFFEGTAEGPGMPKAVGNITRGLCKFMKTKEIFLSRFKDPEIREDILEKYRRNGKKDILLESGNNKMLGTKRIDKLFIPKWTDQAIRVLKTAFEIGAMPQKPWTPEILPIQLIILGNMAIAGVPGEPTVVAGWRLRDTIKEVLSKRGVEHVILSPYANAYQGYITTPEEYAFQFYEGGHTVFGKWTLPAFQTKFKYLAEQLLLKPEDRNLEGPELVEYSEEELVLQTQIAAAL